MKKIILCVALCMPIIFSMAPIAMTAEVSVKINEDAQARLDAYKKLIQDTHKATINIDKEEFYKDWQAIDAHTQKPYHLSDISALEKQGFYLYRAEQLSASIKSVYDNLQKSITALEQSKVEFDANQPDDGTKDEQIEEVNLIIEELHLIVKNLQIERKLLAIKFEELIEKAIKDNANNKPLVKELQNYLKDIKHKHDFERLVKRKESP